MEEVSLERNEHGHVVVRVRGLGFSGAHELGSLGPGSVDSLALKMFIQPDYDAQHRLVAGQEYVAVILPGNCINESARTMVRLHAEASRFSYRKPIAGVISFLHEAISAEALKEMGFDTLIVMHDPIEDTAGNKSMFDLYRDTCRGEDVRKIGTCWVNPKEGDRKFGNNIGFVYFA
jgi:hypothetical protein